MVQRRPRATAIEIALVAALAVWGLWPLVLALVHAADTHTTFTGADGLIGADGVLGADQLQYLAWIRDAAGHGLASDLFTLAPSGHVYLQPIFTIAGGLTALGLSPALAYLLFKPVAILALGLAGLVWTRRLIPAEAVAARAAALALTLFLYTPVAALLSWTQAGSGSTRFSLYLLAYEVLGANKLWGYAPSAIGLALVPVAMLAADRALARATAPGGAALIAAAAALTAAWLHPWQGITLIIVFAGLAIVRRGRGWPVLAIAAAGAAVPLGYYWLLSHTDPAWRLASHYEVIPRLPAIVLLAGLGPLALIAALGVRRPGGEPIEQALLLWIAGCLITYFVNDAFAPHALQGLSFPIAILAVRGFTRLRLPRAAALTLGIAAVAILTVPGLAYDARKFARTADNSKLVQYYLPHDDSRALSWVADHAPPGGVLAPTPLALVIPAQTGRAVWVGHGYWSRDYVARARQANRLFTGRMRPAAARALVAASGARVLVADCRHHGNLARPLRSLLATERRFGCARVYVLRGAGAGRSTSR
jgi:hypothetical protein